MITTYLYSCKRSHPARILTKPRDRLEEFLGHVRATTLVDDVRHGEEHLTGDDEEEEKAHARCRRRDDYCDWLIEN